ncbi:lipocalin family protein [Salegentibacter sp. F188]|uniref:Type IV secretion system putative lipoprotein virB7 n=1 Tax=Autumnicola patrickiae TaxID=3075591 RepID=A0ABU3DXG6_9FLAO|nr:lipocalin family protein [Salegentibacter sp. F188]MDT0688414.1 lipocalin family protein [Salegentibacter sp. F188]
MKKIFLLFMSIAVLSSCSNDDDSSGNSENNILGTWGLVEINNAGDFLIPVNECTSQSQITFNSDGTAISEYYMNTDGECTVDSEEGNWSGGGNNDKYIFRIPILGSQPGRVDFNDDYSRFTFYPDALMTQNTHIIFEKK